MDALGNTNAIRHPIGYADTHGYAYRVTDADANAKAHPYTNSHPLTFVKDNSPTILWRGPSKKHGSFIQEHHGRASAVSIE